MRICLFTPNFLPAVGGTELVTDALARQFTEMGHHAVVLAQGPARAVDVPYAVEWFLRPVLPRLFPERVAKALAASHARHRFDIFACNYAHPTGYAAVRIAPRLGVPVVIISHGGDLYRSSKDRNRPHLWKRTLHAYRQADGLIAISPYIEQLIREINPAPRCFELIPNGIDIAALHQSATRPADFTDTRPFILCLGNLGPMKGFGDAITAYAKVCNQLNGAALVIVGSGELGNALQEQVRTAGLQNDVLFMGKRVGNDKRWFLHHCRFGLMPSIEEGHPIVGLEFLAVGKPLVCTLNAAFDGMYDDGVNAYRVPAQNPDALADAMVRMSAGNTASMGAESRRRAESYTWPAIATRYLAFFDRVRRTHH